MSWITIVWSMNAAACLTLAALYLLVWCKQRENWVYLVFSSSAVAAAAIAAFELAMMHCETVGRYEATRALDTCASVGAHCLLREFRAALSPRRTTMARVEYLRPADTGVNSQFRSYAESELPPNNKPSSVLVGER